MTTFLKDVMGDKEGFKVDYSKVKKAVMKCEFDKKEGELNQECKRIFKELNIDVY